MGMQFNSRDMGPAQWADALAKNIEDLKAYERDRLPQLPEELRAERQKGIDEARAQAEQSAEVLARWIAQDALRDF